MCCDPRPTADSLNPSHPVAPATQPHYEIVVDAATSTADLRAREDVDAEAVISKIPLAEGVSGEIVQLFKAIDADGSGGLTEEDFVKLMDDDVEAVASTWAVLANQFDNNSDGEVTM